MIIDQTQVQIVSIENQIAAGCKGPLAARFVLDFTAAAQYDLDLQNLQATNRFDSCQSIFIDNQTGTDMVLTIPGSGQVILAKANTQGFYNALVPNPIKMSFVSAGGAVINVFLVNVPIPGAVWPTV